MPPIKPRFWSYAKVRFCSFASRTQVFPVFMGVASPVTFFGYRITVGFTEATATSLSAPSLGFALSDEVVRFILG